jgi:hypothetical protein
MIGQRGTVRRADISYGSDQKIKQPELLRNGRTEDENQTKIRCIINYNCRECKSIRIQFKIHEIIFVCSFVKTFRIDHI